MKALIPDPLDSDAQYSRFSHYDLVDMGTEDLLYELYALRAHLWFLKSDRYARITGFFEQGQRVQWLEARISRIGAELQRRRYDKPAVKAQPKAKLAEGVRL